MPLHLRTPHVTESRPSRRRAFRVGVLPLLAVFSVLIAACGSSSSSPSNSSSSTTTTVSSGSATSSTTAKATPTTAVAIGAGSKFCTFAANAQKNSSQSVATGKPASIEAAYKQLQSEEPAILAAAPPQIKGDFQTLFTFFNKFYGELASIGYNYAKLPVSYAQSLAASSAQVAAASTAIGTYLAKTCG